MFKNEASLFKNASPCITKDDSHCSRAGHSFTFLDLGFLTEIQKEAVRTGKPGNGKSRLRRKIGLKQQGVLQSRAGVEGTGRAVGESSAGLAREFRGGVRDAADVQHQQGAHPEPNIHSLSDSHGGTGVGSRYGARCSKLQNTCNVACFILVAFP